MAAIQTSRAHLAEPVGTVRKDEIRTIRYDVVIEDEPPANAQIEIYVNGKVIRRISPYTRPYYQLFGHSRTELVMDELTTAIRTYGD